MVNKKALLIILDGWGKGPKSSSNAIFMSKTPCMDALYAAYPNSELLTSGEDVGLPDGQMGNSEVGHLNIGAGRVVYQDFAKINKAVREKTINTNLALLASFEYLKKTGKALHLIGLVSDGGIHSHIDHLIAVVNCAADNGIKKIFIHAFTDGRDCDPKSGIQHIAKLEKAIQGKAKIASLGGRYYAMDRDKRWERVKLAYDAMVKGEGKQYNSASVAVQQSYDANITDEFILPCVITENNAPVAKIQEGDAVFCFNFRTDRCREITTVLTQTDMPDHGMKTIPLYYLTMTNYDDSYKNVHVLYSKENLHNTLGEVVSNAGRTQLRISETEKYPHVTFFFSGGKEEKFKGEERIMIASPKVATYDLQPEMNAVQVKDAVVKAILGEGSASPDFICLNFANPDMVGHTGVFSAIQKAIECVDACLSEVVAAALTKDYSTIIIADHGNADFAVNADGSPNTAHTKNPVPCILVSKEKRHIANGRLCDLAPTILRIMDLPVPLEMTGKVLI